VSTAICPNMREPAASVTTPAPAVSVVAPVFGNAASLAALAERIDAAVSGIGAPHEIVLVDDASRDDSWRRIDDLARARAHVRGVRHARNRGQHAAALTGLAHARGDVCVVMDADLQDPPEAIPPLVAALAQTGADVVFAGRRGDYQAWHRMLTSRIYRGLLLGALTDLPPDAGMFFAIGRPALARLLAVEVRDPMVIGMIAAARLRCTSIPVPRAARAHGRSAYSEWRRLRAALNMLRCAWLAPPRRAIPAREEGVVAGRCDRPRGR
jgi:polyisoprenyl-phosphate glycosyltransferase